MARLIWSEKAVSDLDDIKDYISIASNKYASIQIKRIFKRV